MSRACSFPCQRGPFRTADGGKAPRYAKPKALQPWSCARGGPQSPAISTGRSSVRLQQRPRALHATLDMNTAVAAAGLATFDLNVCEVIRATSTGPRLEFAVQLLGRFVAIAFQV